MRFTTRLLHEAFAPDAATGATTQPLYQTSAFYQPTAEEMARVFAGRKPGFVYTRVNNPTVARFEQRVNALEGGVGAVACASGMAAVSHAVLNILSQGDEILASGGLYGGTSSLFRDFASYGIGVRYAAGGSVADFRAALTERTRLIYIETIGNPKLDVVDIAALSELAHAHGVPLFVDNTVTTPYLCQPLALGADVVIHSTSKALNGNGNSIGGIVVSGGKFRWDAARFPKLREYPFGPMSYLVRLRLRMVTDYGAVQRVSHGHRARYARAAPRPHHGERAFARHVLRGARGARELPRSAGASLACTRGAPVRRALRRDAHAASRHTEARVPFHRCAALRAQCLEHRRRAHARDPSGFDDLPPRERGGKGECRRHGRSRADQCGIGRYRGSAGGFRAGARRALNAKP